MDLNKFVQNLSLEQQKIVFDSIKDSVSQARQMQRKKVAENVDIVLQALKKIDSDIRERYDLVGNQLEKRISNIKDGRDGINGRNGRDGKDGKPGKDGATGRPGRDGKDGKDGRDGIDGISVISANIDFDGSLIIKLSNGKEINVGEVVPMDLAERIKIIGNGGGTSQTVLDTLDSLQTQINNLIPSQTGNAGKVLTTDGSTLSWTAAIGGGLSYQGTWNASTNTPTLASATGTNGYYYVVGVSGSTNLDGISDWVAGDWLLFNGSNWQKIDQTNLVTSVNSQTGAVTLTASDVGAATSAQGALADSAVQPGDNVSSLTNDSGFITASSTDTLTNKSGNISQWTNDSGYLTSYTETDPVFVASPAYGITSTNITNWDTAYGWGNHASAGYAADSGVVHNTGNESVAGVKTLSSNPILSAGTANGVAYLNGSKALTTGSALTFDGTNFATTGSITSAGANNSGNMTFTGTGNRITGDFSNATVANRVAFQSSTTNGNTVVSALPNGTATTSGFRAYNNSDLSNNANLIMSIDGTLASIQSQAVGTGTYLPMTFYTGGSERVRIDTSGNVGIGTSSPTNALQLVGTAKASSQLYVGSNSDDNYSGGVQNLSNSSRSISIQADPTNSGANTILTFSVDGSEHARIDSSGNLLVGTTGGVGSVGRIQAVQATSTGNAVISADAQSSSYAYNIAYLNTNTAAGTGFYFISCTTGNYGTYQFRVRGDGTIYAQNTTVQSLSDVRVKENIRDSEDGLQVVLGLQPRRFDFKQGFGNDRKNVLGFIAQEIEVVFPDAVDITPVDPDGEGPEEPYKSVGPGALIPVLVKAIQEQQVIIEQLKARLDAANL